MTIIVKTISLVVSSFLCLSGAQASGFLSQQSLPAGASVVAVPKHDEHLLLDENSGELARPAHGKPWWLVFEPAPLLATLEDPVPEPDEEAVAKTKTVETFATVYFGFDKTMPKNTGTLVPLLRDAVSGNASVSVTGHADSVGAREVNQRVAKKRADAVSAYLRKHHVESGRISVDGKGDSVPVASNKTKAGRAQNRRAEVSVKREVPDSE